MRAPFSGDGLYQLSVQHACLNIGPTHPIVMHPKMTLGLPVEVISGIFGGMLTNLKTEWARRINLELNGFRQ